MAGEPRGSLWEKAGWPLGQSKLPSPQKRRATGTGAAASQLMAPAIDLKPYRERGLWF